MRVDFTFGSSRAPRRRDEGTPARLLILANLRGQAPEAPQPLLDRPIPRVDIDNVEDLLDRHAPSIVLGAEAGGEQLEFRTLNDFHPDALVQKAPLFGRLLDLRRRLQQPGTFASAVAELRAEAATTDTLPSRATAPPATSPPAADDSRATLERLLGQKPAAAPITQQPSRLHVTIDDLIRSIVAPHVVPAVDAELPQLLSAVDTALTDVMRRVLHDPAFQDVEATWRGIHWLVSSLELGEDLELYLLHVTRDELSRGAGPESDLYGRLVDREVRTAGGLQFSALVGNYQFGATPEDLSILEAMGGLGRALGAPFVAGCGPSLLGAAAMVEQPDPRDWKPLAPDVDGKWRALRASAVARHLGLAFPRFMLRRPYGDRSDRIEAFRFEEQPPRPEHGAFLWGHPAFACAAVLARVLVSDEDAQNLGDVGGLPTFAWVGDEETRLQPCTEVSLSERAIEAILTRGIMPLVGFKDRDVARLVRLQSIADPPTPLGG